MANQYLLQQLLCKCRWSVGKSMLV